MSDSRILLGAVASKLESNNYAATSYTAPGKRCDYKTVDDEASVLLMPGASSGFEDYHQRRVCALIVGARSTKARADVFAVLKRAKLDGGLQRTASDGSITFVLRYENTYGPLWTRETRHAPEETQPAVILVGEGTHPRFGVVSAPNVLRVDGAWKDGRDLLTVARSDLPDLSDADSLFESIDALFTPAYLRPGTRKEFIHEPQKLERATGLTAKEREGFRADARGGYLSHRDRAAAAALGADDSGSD